jgi:hypothetical protein
MSNGFGSEFKDMTNGQLKSGTLSSNSQATAAKANKLLREISKLAKEQDDGSPLTKQQLADAAVAENMGIPRSVARLLAKQPLTPEVKSNIAKLQKASTKGARNFRFARRNRRSRNNVMSFSGGTGLAGKKSNRNSRNSYRSNKGKRKPAASNGKTMNFKMAQEAAKDADINKQPETIIFEIISRRYKVSAWRRLDLE